MKYKILLFDLDNTLLDFDANEKESLIKVLEHFGISATSEIMNKYDTVNKELWKSYELGNIKLEEVLNTRFSKTMAHFNREICGKTWEAQYRQNLGEGAQLIENAYEVCEQLAKTHRLFIATNGITVTQIKRLEKSGLIKFFEGIFTSQDIGHQKPSSNFFNHVKENIKEFVQEDTLMIGDSYNTDIIGGNDAGIDTCWFRSVKNDADVSCKSTYKIKNIKELLDICL